MSTPDKNKELEKLLDTYYSARYVEEGDTRTLAQGVFEMAKAHSDIESLIQAARVELPQPYTAEQIKGATSNTDEEYMRGFNRCLEDIQALNNIGGKAEELTLPTENTNG